jgi:putative autotransporter adhesin-like protein
MFPIARLTVPLAALAACVALAASAADRRETRPVSGFSSIGLAAPIKVQLTQADADSLVLEGAAEALDDLETVVENGSLKIRTKSKSTVTGMHKVRAYVTARNIEGLAISGSGDITAPALRSAKLRVAISGSGDVRIGELNASSLDVSVSGSGDVTVAGKADEVATSIAGSGDVRAGKLESRQSKVSIAGSGDATLWARESLAVSIVGSGDVKYYGDPSVKKAIVGSGSVRRVGATPS